MRRRRSRYIRFLGIAAAIAMMIALVPGTRVQAAPTVQILATGLNNPRGLAFDSIGQLYVAEAGSGGSGACIPSEQGGPECLGATGSITRIWDGQQKRIVTGLPSLAGADGSEASGPDDVAIPQLGVMDVSIGLGATADQRATLGGDAAHLGTVVRIEHQSDAMPNIIDWQHAADLAAYEQANNPVPGGTDSNPYALVADPFGEDVVDAGGNDLLRVNVYGQISTEATFPTRLTGAPGVLPSPAAQVPMQSVPDSITRSPFGQLLVGELTGFPFTPGAANVYQVNPRQAPIVYASGFTNIIGVAAAGDGSLYVLEIAGSGLLGAQGPTTGQLIRVAPDGTRTVILSDGLVSPTGLAIGPDGALYVSNYGTSAGKGEVLRILP